MIVLLFQLWPMNWFKFFAFYLIFCVQVYVVARNNRLTFFKDQKASKSTPETTFRGETPLVLDGANVDVEDHKKRKHVFRLKWVKWLINVVKIHLGHKYGKKQIK